MSKEQEDEVCDATKMNKGQDDDYNN